MLHRNPVSASILMGVSNVISTSETDAAVIPPATAGRRFGKCTFTKLANNLALEMCTGSLLPSDMSNNT